MAVGEKQQPHEDDARVLFERVPLTVTRELRALARRDWDFMRRMDPCDLKPLRNAIDDWLTARKANAIDDWLAARKENPDGS